MHARASLRAAIAVTAALAAAACNRESPAPPASGPPPEAGVTQVTGRERLEWDQPGDGSRYSYRGYLNGQAVPLDATGCAGDGASSVCSAPLPTMPDGVHTLQVMAVDYATGGESDLSEPITVQKITSRAARAPSSWGSGGSPQIAPAADLRVVLRGVRMPAQLTTLPDGRLLVAEAIGRVLVVRPDSTDQPAVALEAGALLEPAPSGPLAIAAHPDFAATGHVYVADLYSTSDRSVRARIIRMREVGDRLGEPSTVFDAPVSVAEHLDDDASIETRAGAEGMRLAFGTDDHLYAALPRGVVFEGQPAASRPIPALVRLEADGSTPDAGAVQGVTSHPLAFGWDPSTGTLLGLLAERAEGAATLHALGDVATPSSLAPGVVRFRTAQAGAASLLRMDAAGATPITTADVMMLAAAGRLPRAVRLAVPADVETMMSGIPGRLGDLVIDAGVIYAAISDAPTLQSAGIDQGVIVRLRH